MVRTRTFCEVDDCGAPSVGRGMCKKHWQRWRKWGDPRRVDNRWKQTDADRFFAHVHKTESCWTWTGTTKNGYGCFYVTREGVNRMVQAHRFAYELLVGRLGKGVTLDHACHTVVASSCTVASQCPHRACVRPEHLEPMSLAENIGIGGNGAKTHCKRGHEFTSENTGAATWSGPHARYCRTCKREQGRRLRERRRAGA